MIPYTVLVSYGCTVLELLIFMIDIEHFMAAIRWPVVQFSTHVKIYKVECEIPRVWYDYSTNTMN